MGSKSIGLALQLDVNLPLFYFVFEGNFPIISSPQGAYIWRGDLKEGFLQYRFGGLIFGAWAYTWRGFFLQFYGNCHH